MPALRKRQGQPGSVTPATIPAPIGGLNTVAPGVMMPELDCPLLWNMVSAENGLRSRLGSREWVTGLTGAADNLVRTMLTFKGSATNGTSDRAFAVTSSGIWDVTTSTATPTIALAFGITSGNAGYGVAHAVVTSAGHFLLYCDEANGYHVYTESTDTWAAVTMGGGATQVSGADPANFRFVAVHKNRIIFAKADSQTAYYLGTGSAIFGAATAFPLNLQFKNGGHLVGMWNWTYDGGSGMDDLLVFASAGADIAIYEGTDLTSANTIAIKGVWNVGGLPTFGRQVASPYGGDLLFITKAGLLPLSRLVSGANLQDAETYTTYKVSNLFNQLMLAKASLPGWSIRLNPEDNTLLVTVPTFAEQATQQLALSVASKSWSRYDGLPIYSSVMHDGKLYYGTVDGKVGIHDGEIDGVLLSDPQAYTPIQWRCITAFRTFGAGRQTQLVSIRPKILAEDSDPDFEVAARYNYNLTELASVATDAPGAGSWDVGEWDEAIWGDAYNPIQPVLGASGMGIDTAIAIRGAATSRTILVGFDILYRQGGWL